MSDYDPLVQLAGYVGNKPEIKEGKNGSSFTVFRLGVNRFYNEEDGEKTRWYSIAVNKPVLQEWVRKNIQKGMAVAVEGSASETTVNGVTYHNLSAFRVGHVEWFVSGAAPPRENVDDDL